MLEFASGCCCASKSPRDRKVALGTLYGLLTLIQLDFRPHDTLLMSVTHCRLFLFLSMGNKCQVCPQTKQQKNDNQRHCMAPAHV
mmetsp:Transcript_35490/g.65176  ORF Transcript_35490/g.65176 Transcript_35490/m.65176 type:complete len:85 (-) Transcript_35490:447-701(-)